MKLAVRRMLALLVIGAALVVIPGASAAGAHQTLGQWHEATCPDLRPSPVGTTAACVGAPENPVSGGVTQTWSVERTDFGVNIKMKVSAGTTGSLAVCQRRTSAGGHQYDVFSTASTTYSAPLTLATHQLYDGSGAAVTWGYLAFFAPGSVTTGQGCSAYDGGPTPPPVATGEPASYECGRSLDEAGDGRYFVDLRAIGPANPPAAGVTEEVYWYAEWDGWVPHEGKRVELLTPPLTDMPSGGWIAKFMAVRTFESGVVGDKRFTDAPPDEIDWAQFGESDDPGGVPGWGLIPDAPRNAWKQLEENLENALGRLASRIRFWEDEAATEPMTRAEVEGATEYTKVESECRVLVDPRNPDDGASSSTNIEIYNPEGYESPSDEELAGEDPAATEDNSCLDGVGLRLNWNPLVIIGSALNTIVKPLLCGLKALFIPEDLDWDGLWSDVREGFPFTVVDEIAGLFDAVLDLANGGLTAAACATVDATAAVPYAAEMGETVEFDLPSPTGSGCAGAGGPVGDLFGKRELLRNLMAGSMWLAVLVRLSGSVGPKRTLEVPV